MKIGKAHRTQSSSWYSANTIGAPMHPAPIGVADWSGKKYYWRTVPGQQCLLEEGDNILAHRGPPTPIYWHSDVPCANSISISIILYARLFLQSSELGPPNPLTHRWVCPPFGARGGHTCRRGGGWGPNTRGQTLWYSRYHVTSFTSPIGDWT
jgi:hypothetical protein